MRERQLVFLVVNFSTGGSENAHPLFWLLLCLSGSWCRVTIIVTDIVENVSPSAILTSIQYLIYYWDVCILIHLQFLFLILRSYILKSTLKINYWIDIFQAFSLYDVLKCHIWILENIWYEICRLLQYTNCTECVLLCICVCSCVSEIWCSLLFPSIRK